MSEIIFREPKSVEQIDAGRLELMTLAAFIKQKEPEIDSLMKEAEKGESIEFLLFVFAAISSFQSFIEEKEKLLIYLVLKVWKTVKNGITRLVICIITKIEPLTRALSFLGGI